MRILWFLFGRFAWAKKVKDAFTNPDKKFVENFLPKLLKLRDELRRLRSGTEDPLQDLIDFLNAVAEWHDSGFGEEVELLKEVNYGQYDNILNNLHQLEILISKCGRDRAGLNRTRKGEPVNESNIWMGGFYGLPPLRILDWRKHRDDPKGKQSINNAENMNGYDLVCREAQRYLAENALPIQSDIGNIEVIARRLIE